MALNGIIRGRYKILEEIGRGGFGIAYRACDILVGRVVVVKQLHDWAITEVDNKARRLFETEWRSLAQLSEHPNIVYLIDLLEDQNAFVMQYAGGGNLTERIKSKIKLPLLEAVSILAEVSDGLAAVHRLNIVHRDIKPSNILLTPEGQAKISDFGIAHQLHEAQDQDLILSDFNLGTINYMAPEQARGDRLITPLADIYSAGSTLFAAVTGRYYLPFRVVKDEHDAGTLAYNFKLVIEREADKPRCYNPAIPSSLEKLILRCLEKEPGKRYPCAEELGFDLGQIRAELEEERNEAYLKAESFLEKGQDLPALKLYDKVLAIDENFSQAKVHRELTWQASNQAKVNFGPLQFLEGNPPAVERLPTEIRFKPNPRLNSGLEPDQPTSKDSAASPAVSPASEYTRALAPQDTPGQNHFSQVLNPVTPSPTVSSKG